MIPIARIYALHGFLGTPRDWDFLSAAEGCLKAKIEAVDLMSYALDSSLDSLTSWAAAFNQTVRESEKAPNCLLGYSLGGRLALHCLAQDPDLWQAAIIVSAHYGLAAPEEKEARRFNDLQWAHRFEQEPWAALMEAWNAQLVFNSQPDFKESFKRREQDYSRSQLAAVLNNFSLGTQANLLPMVCQLPQPLLWITGSQDLKFTALTKGMHLKNPFSRIRAIPDAGHRVPWEQPDGFVREVHDFLEYFRSSE